MQDGQSLQTPDQTNSLIRRRTFIPAATFVLFTEPCQRNLIEALQNEAITPLITKITLNIFLNIFRRSY